MYRILKKISPLPILLHPPKRLGFWVTAHLTGMWKGEIRLKRKSSKGL